MNEKDILESSKSDEDSQMKSSSIPASSSSSGLNLSMGEVPLVKDNLIETDDEASNRVKCKKFQKLYDSPYVDIGIK